MAPGADLRIMAVVAETAGMVPAVDVAKAPLTSKSSSVLDVSALVAVDAAAAAEAVPRNSRFLKARWWA